MNGDELSPGDVLTEDLPPVTKPTAARRGPGRPRKTARKATKAPADKAPRQGRTEGGKFAPAGGGLTLPQIEAGLTNQLAGIGLIVSGFDPVCGGSLIQGAPALSSSLVEVAKSNPSVRRTLENLVTASAWGNVMMAAAAIIYPMLVHHNIVPALNLGGLGPIPEPAHANGNGNGEHGA